MPVRTPRRPSRAAVLPFVPVLVLLLLAGCSREKREAGPAVSDTTAYQGALALPDTTARIDALEAFLDKYEQSPFRAAVYSRLYGLMEKRDPAQAGSFLASRLEKEKDPEARGRLHAHYCGWVRDHAPERVDAALEALASDPNASADAYNMVAWDMVEREDRLDDAIRLAAIGVEREADSTAKASVLDTQGWAHFKKGEYARAVELLEQAVAYSPEDELRAHLAEAYDKAGMKEKARDLYAELLVPQEDPSMRARVEALSRELGGDVAAIFSSIDRRREEAARPAPDFTLKDYDGKEVHLADYRGQVILLNFWHPT